MPLVFKDELDFEDAVMRAIKNRLVAEVWIERKVPAGDIAVTLDISDSDQDGFGLITRAQDTE